MKNSARLLVSGTLLSVFIWLALSMVADNPLIRFAGARRGRTLPDLAIINLHVGPPVSKVANYYLPLTMQSVCLSETVFDWYFIYVPTVGGGSDDGDNDDEHLPKAVRGAVANCTNVFVHRLDEMTLIREFLMPAIALWLGDDVGHDDAPGPGADGPLLTEEEWRERLRRGRIQWTRAASWHLFHHLLQPDRGPYRYWGFADPDVVHGLKTPTGDFDIVTSRFQTIQIRPVYMHGHWAVFRNTPFVNNLWRNHEVCPPLRHWRRQFLLDDFSEDEGFFTGCVLQAARRGLISALWKRMESADLKPDLIDPQDGCFDIQLALGPAEARGGGAFVAADPHGAGTASANTNPYDQVRLWIHRAHVPGTNPCRLLTPGAGNARHVPLTSARQLGKLDVTEDEWLGAPWVPDPGARWALADTDKLSAFYENDNILAFRDAFSHYDLRGYHILLHGPHAALVPWPGSSSPVQTSFHSQSLSAASSSTAATSKSVSGPGECGTYTVEVAELFYWKKQMWNRPEFQTTHPYSFDDVLPPTEALRFLFVANDSGIFRLPFERAEPIVLRAKHHSGNKKCPNISVPADEYGWYREAYDIWDSSE